MQWKVATPTVASPSSFVHQRQSWHLTISKHNLDHPSFPPHTLKVNVYVFWIHHEEVEGQFDFTGRRNVRRFIQLAHSLGLKVLLVSRCTATLSLLSCSDCSTITLVSQVLLRAGPWDHGECRNGGHPDWMIAKAASEVRCTP